MSADNVRPDLVRQVQTLRAQVAELARRRLPAFGTPDTFTEKFSYPGPLSNGVESPRLYIEDGAVTFTQARVSLTAAASSDHLIDLKKDGTLYTTLTLPSGDSTVIVPIALEVRAQSYLTVVTNTVADSDLSVILAAQ